MDIELEFDDARAAVIASLTPLQTQPIALADALGRALAEPVNACWDLPPYPNAAMDGYALRSADLSEGRALRVVDTLTAGRMAETTRLCDGETVSIMTGAAIPEGVIAVVPQEWVVGDGSVITLVKPVTPGQNIRRPGEDVKRDSPAVPAGIALDAASIAMLAQFGVMEPAVVRAPRLAVLTCGDELRQPPYRPGAAEVVDCNALAVCAAARSLGALADVLPPVPDQHDAIQQALEQRLAGADMLVVIAGASHGVLDLATEMLEAIGIEWRFNCVNVRPGRPVAFGVLPDGRPVFSLPGNPVSALLLFDALVRPAIAALSGIRHPLGDQFEAVLEEPLSGRVGRTRLVRICLRFANGQWFARSAGSQKSGLLSTSVNMDGIAIIDPEVGALTEGDRVRVYRPI